MKKGLLSFLAFGILLASSTSAFAFHRSFWVKGSGYAESTINQTVSSDSGPFDVLTAVWNQAYATAVGVAQQKCESRGGVLNAEGSSSCGNNYAFPMQCKVALKKAKCYYADRFCCEPPQKD